MDSEEKSKEIERRKFIFPRGMGLPTSGHLGRPVIGRIAYEVFRLAEAEPEKVRNIYETYGNVTKYDFSIDPENLIQHINVPFVGTLNQEIQHSKSGSEEQPIISDELLPPYTSFLSDRRIFTNIFCCDSQNSYRGKFEENSSVLAELIEAWKKVEDDGSFDLSACSLDLETLLDKRWRDTMKVWAYYCCARGKEDYHPDNDSVLSKRDLSFALPDHLYLESSDSALMSNVPVSIDFYLGLCDDAFDLCNLYLSEMNESGLSEILSSKGIKVKI